jgi:hypothetical protein
MDYFSRRASQERRAAQSAGDPRARRCHEQLARLHSTAGKKGLPLPDGEEEPDSALPHFLILH